MQQAKTDVNKHPLTSAPCDARDLVLGCPGLVTLPRVYHLVTARLTDMSAEPGALAAAVALDPGLSAEVLRRVNQPCYGLPGRITAIDEAVDMLEADDLRAVARGARAMDRFPGLPHHLIQVSDLWQQGLRTGLAARLIAQRHLSDELAAPCYAAGLLHDIGSQIVCLLLPELACQAVAREPGVCRTVEQAVMHADSAVIGREWADHWRLPSLLRDAIGYHPCPDVAPAFPQAAAVVQLARLLAQAPEHQLEAALETVAKPVWSLTGCDVRQLKKLQPEMEGEYQVVLARLP